MTVVSARGLVKTYGRGRAARRVLDGAGALLAVYEPHKADTVKPAVVLT